MTTLNPRSGFDWTLVQWGGPKQRRTTRCSFCAEPFRDCEMPLILWKPDGSAAEFCENCQRRSGIRWKGGGPND
jgi:hypothetical protein